MSTVSVIIPTYNRANWLPETVASILNQTQPPLEILIIDDGSTDDSAAVCATFPETVRYIRQQNAGVSAARNRGMREAKGKWIAFADSDDPWEPTKLEVQLKVMEVVPEAKWSITGCTVIDLEGRSVQGTQSWSRVFAAFKGGAIDPDQHFANWLKKTEIAVGAERHQVYWGDSYGLLFLGNVVLPSSALILKELANRVGGFDETFRLAEETEFFHRVSASAPVAIVMSSLAHYRIGQAISLISPVNMVRIVENALVSLDRAVQLRGTLSGQERSAFNAGRKLLLSRLAYTRLTNFDRAGARSALKMAWKQGATWDTQSLGIFIVTFLPVPVLQCLQAIKSRLTLLR